MRVAVNSSRSLRRYMIASGVNPHDNFLLFFEGRLEFWGGGGIRASSDLSGPLPD